MKASRCCEAQKPRFKNILEAVGGFLGMTSQNVTCQNPPNPLQSCLPRLLRMGDALARLNTISMAKNTQQNTPQITSIAA